MYLGISLILGPSVIAWCDKRVAALCATNKKENVVSKTAPQSMRVELIFF